MESEGLSMWDMIVTWIVLGTIVLSALIIGRRLGPPR
jgi:hypothetical protein